MRRAIRTITPRRRIPGKHVEEISRRSSLGLSAVFFCGIRLGLQFAEATVRGWKRGALRASAHVGESSPAVALTSEVNAGEVLVGDTQHLTDGNFGWVAGELAAAVHAAATDDEAGATKLEENLFEVFGRDAIARSDFVNRNDAGILHGEMENRSCRVLPFCRNSHKFGV